jgi:hypothetical protein
MLPKVFTSVRRDQMRVLITCGLLASGASLTSFLTQPLDVSVFQLYKYWYKKAVQHAMYSLDLDYNVASFMHDMQEIQVPY